MLASSQRLRAKKDYDRVYRHGHYAHAQWLTLRACQGMRGMTRCGIVVPNMVVRRAVARNRIRRQLRALMAAQMSSLPTGYDYVLQVRAQPPSAMTDIREAFSAACMRLFQGQGRR